MHVLLPSGLERRPFPTAARKQKTTAETPSSGPPKVDRNRRVFQSIGKTRSLSRQVFSSAFHATLAFVVTYPRHFIENDYIIAAVGPSNGGGNTVASARSRFIIVCFIFATNCDTFTLINDFARRTKRHVHTQAGRCRHTHDFYSRASGLSRAEIAGFRINPSRMPLNLTDQWGISR